MRGVIIGDQMNLKPDRNVALEMIKKREKFPMAVARLALRDCRAVKHIERGDQRGSAVPEVVVGHPFDVTQPHRQNRLSTLQHLYLTLFVHAQRRSFSGRLARGFYALARLSILYLLASLAFSKHLL